MKRREEAIEAGFAAVTETDGDEGEGGGLPSYGAAFGMPIVPGGGRETLIRKS